MSLSYIHAADFHLGADLRRFGPARDRLEKAQFLALEKTMRWAAEEQAAFVLICGDLFDRRNPPKSVLRKTGKILTAIPEMPVYILPGTHDFLSENSVLIRARVDWTGSNIVVLDDTMTSPHQVAGKKCFLYFRPNRSNRSERSPIYGLMRGEQEGYHIGLAHGSLRIGGLDFALDFPLDPAEIEKTGFNYLALGHWHNGRVEKCGSTTAAYPGIAQPISWSDPEIGQVLLVRHEDTGQVMVEPRPVSSIAFKKIEASIHHPLEVSRLVERAADPDTIVKLALKISDNLNDTLEVEEIIKGASSRFLLVQADKQNLGNSGASLSVPDNTNEQLIKAFRAEIARMKDADSPERSELYEKAAKLGISVIIGEE